MSWFIHFSTSFERNLSDWEIFLIHILSTISERNLSYWEAFWLRHFLPYSRIKSLQPSEENTSLLVFKAWTSTHNRPRVANWSRLCCKTRISSVTNELRISEVKSQPGKSTTNCEQQVIPIRAYFKMKSLHFKIPRKTIDPLQPNLTLCTNYWDLGVKNHVTPPELCMSELSSPWNEK